MQCREHYAREDYKPYRIGGALMAIGNFGKLIRFEVNSKKFLSPQDFEKELSGRWAEHPRLYKAPLRQFLGPDLAKVTFTIYLDARHGVKPRKTMSNIQKYVKNGRPETLVIGGQKVGGNTKWTINKINEYWVEIWNKGEVVRAKVKLTLEEYPTS